MSKTMDLGNKVCSECDGTGKVYYSCCGDDVKGTLHEDYGICPTCKEHLSGEHEDCESCGGIGFIINKTKDNG